MGLRHSQPRETAARPSLGMVRADVQPVQTRIGLRQLGDEALVDRAQDVLGEVAAGDPGLVGHHHGRHAGRD